MSVVSALLRIASLPLGVDRPSFRIADAIVVLGAPTAHDGALTDIVDERVRAGCELFRRGLAPTLVMSGKNEAIPMAERAIEFGVPATAITTENESRTTAENARRCAGLLPSAKVVWVVSQPFHLRRAALLFRREGIRALPFCSSDSIQFSQPARGLKMTAREYAAWVRLGAEALVRR